MGTKNEETITRSTQAESESVGITGGRGTARGESKTTRNQQERDHRARSSESSIFSPGTAVTGGMLDHLIDEYCDQMAAKQDEIEHLQNEIKRIQSRVQEFKALREELKRQSEEE
jgi:HAMP domain-containing protein